MEGEQRLWTEQGQPFTQGAGRIDSPAPDLGRRSAAHQSLHPRGLAGLSVGAMGIWERGERLPGPNVARRLGILLYETRHLPVGETPCCRRRLPHPELPALMARVAPQLAAYPVRTRWGRG